MRPTTAHPDTAVRGVLVGLVCGVGAVVAHGVVAGSEVDAVPALLSIAAGQVAGPLLVRRPSTVTLTGGSLLLQLVAHLAMAMSMSMSMSSGSTAHRMHATAAGAGAGGGLAGGASMLLGHLAVAALTAALASGADRAVVSLMRRWLRVAVPLLMQPPVTGRGRPAVVAARRPVLSLVGDVASPRGPPSQAPAAQIA